MSNVRPYSEHMAFNDAESLARAVSFRDHMLRRRTVREFSSRPIATGVVEAALQVALAAPSGAN